MHRRRAVATAAAFLVLAAVAPTRAQTPTGGPSSRSRHPVLERFTATFDATTGGTKYAAVASDPERSAIVYRWSLSSKCGRLGRPEATGPANTYEHGPAVQKPDGCAGDVERAATLTLTIADGAGCAIEYVQGARDEGVHNKPRTRALPCVRLAAESGGGFPAGPVAILILLAGAGLAAALRLQRRPRGEAPAPTPPASAEPDTFVPASGDGSGSSERAVEPGFEPVETCAEGAVRAEATEVVAQETVLAGSALIVATGAANTWQVEIAEATEITRADLASALGVAPGRPLEIRAEVGVRMETATCERREVCRGGRWTSESSARVRESATRTEVLRASVAGPDEFDAFLDEVLGPRLTSLRAGRRRLDEAVERCRAAPSQSAPAVTEGSA